MCKYCEIKDDEYGSYSYYGEDFPLGKVIDGNNQEIEVNICDDIDAESKTIAISGTHLDISISINYCPFCGERI